MIQIPIPDITILEDEIRTHAKKVSPREACGFIIGESENPRLFFVDNISETPMNNFLIHPKQYLEAEQHGKIIGIFHSHPRHLPIPSHADQTICNKGNVPWYIYSLVSDAFAITIPNADEAPILGRQFIWGVYDCYTLIRDYYKQELGIVFPQADYYEERFWEKGNNYYLDRFVNFGFKIVSDIKANDVALITIRSKPKVPNHAGVIMGNGLILHHLQDRLSTTDVYGDSWRRMTLYTIRHESFL
jgi:proteasome lid subunit RPN8/RPN11